jgi:endonuclease/exonuclease/phosphatase family metal-dependent hydrolase
VGDTRLTGAFKSFINRFSLRELLGGGGAKYTWANNHKNLVQSNIDRIMVSTEWETKYPMCQLTSLTRIGSDHNPLLLDIGGGERIGGAKQFFIEKTMAQ